MDKKLDVVNKDNKNKENMPQDKKTNSANENVSPYPEWNEDIHRIVVGYH